MNERPFRSGFAALLGKPNAGKSTLLNRLLRQKLSIVSHKPQTTRHRILGIVNGEGYQLCLLDTPGFLSKTQDGLQKALAAAARDASRDAVDARVLLVEPVLPSPQELEDHLNFLSGGAPLILALNKIDIPMPAGRLDAVAAAYEAALKPSLTLRLSALKGEGVDALTAELIARLPESPPLYEQGQLSDRWERFFAAEIVREKVFELYEQELPHATAVVIELYREEKGRPDHVAATLYVERDGQKGIILGKAGRDLKRLVDQSRGALENFLGRRVDLEVWVKVRHNWRKDPRSLKEFGYLGG